MFLVDGGIHFCLTKAILINSDVSFSCVIYAGYEVHVIQKHSIGFLRANISRFALQASHTVFEAKTYDNRFEHSTLQWLGAKFRTKTYGWRHSNIEKSQKTAQESKHASRCTCTCVLQDFASFLQCRNYNVTTRVSKHSCGICSRQEFATKKYNTEISMLLPDKLQ